MEWGWQLPVLGTAVLCNNTQHTLASSSAISHSNSCSPLGRMPSNPGHLLTSNLFIWSNTSWIFPCIYIDGCCIPASSSHQGFQSKRLGANNSNTTQMKTAALIEGCCQCAFPSRRASLCKPSTHHSAAEQPHKCCPSTCFIYRLDLGTVKRGEKPHSAYGSRFTGCLSSVKPGVLLNGQNHRRPQVL